MNDEIAKWFLYIYAVIAFLIWVIVLVIKAIISRDRELIIKWGLKAELFPKRLSKLKKFLLLYVVGSLGIALISALLGFGNAGLDNEIGKIFLWAASLFLLTALYLSALYFLLFLMEKGNRPAGHREER